MDSNELLESLVNQTICFRGKQQTYFRQRLKDTILERADKPYMACYAYNYCRYVKNLPEMRQIIINHKSKFWAEMYCKHVSDDSDMRQIANQ